MIYDSLLHSTANAAVKFTLIGASGAYGRSLLMQVKGSQRVVPGILCDRDLGVLAGILVELGYDESAFCVVGSKSEIDAASERGLIALTDDAELAAQIPTGAFLDATGVPILGVQLTLAAIEAGSNIVQINKEADVIAGVALARKATTQGVNYTYAHGDQPRNLIELIAWARILGMEVVAAGKSSEYDFIYDADAGTVSCLDRSTGAPNLESVWALDSADIDSTLAARAAMLTTIAAHEPPDYAEISLIANSTGIAPHADALRYPFVRINELADVYGKFADERRKVDRDNRTELDVFNLLRRNDEVSFGGGVFIVVSCPDKATGDVLAGKGHIISQDRRYAVVWHPYHLLGMETPISILDAPRATPQQRTMRPETRVATVGIRTSATIAQGTALEVKGHHHVIADTVPTFLTPSEIDAGAIPYYLADGATSIADLPAEKLLTIHDLEGVNPLLAQLWLDSKH